MGRGETPMGYGELMACLDRLAREERGAEITFIGTSVLGRRIPAVSLGIGGRELLYVGAHHGAEHLTASLLVRFASDYAAGRRRGKRLFGILLGDLWERYRLTVVPMLNPDGCDLAVHGAPSTLSHLIRLNGGSRDFTRWQANGRGVDLNHNYDAGFGEYRRLEERLGISPGPTKWAGPVPESEPETGALLSLIRYQPIRAVLSFHTQGEEIFAGTSPAGRAAAEALSALCGYSLSTPEGTAAYGGLTDYCTAALGIPAFTVECGRGQNPLPTSDFGPLYRRLGKLLFLAPTLF